MQSTVVPTIAVPPAERVREALGLVLADLEPEDRARRLEVMLREAARATTSLAGLFEARREGALVGAVLSQVHVGGTAVVWPPRLTPGEPSSTAQRLLAAATEHLRRKSVSAAHAMLAAPTPEDDAVLRSAGYEPLAELLYLVSRGQVLARAKPGGSLAFEPYCEANHDRLAGVVEATYKGTLDCPGLDDARRIDDVLAGYRATGVFSPDRWLIVRHAGRDVGCLLLADHPKEGNCELVYMGLVGSARGNGWGTGIARHAQWVARTLGRSRLVLAVDAANGPALRAYAAAGFEAWDQRHVYWKRLDGEGN